MGQQPGFSWQGADNPLVLCRKQQKTKFVKIFPRRYKVHGKHGKRWEISEK